MSELWHEKVDYIKFNPQKHHINQTCGGKKTFIPYKRLYTTLNEAQLLQLIHDAKLYRWQALDLTNCGIKKFPDELWDLPELRMLYLGNRINDSTKNIFSVLPRKIELLSNLQVLSLPRNLFQIEGDFAINLPQLLHLRMLCHLFQMCKKAL